MTLQSELNTQNKRSKPTTEKNCLTNSSQIQLDKKRPNVIPANSRKFKQQEAVIPY